MTILRRLSVNRSIWFYSILRGLCSSLIHKQKFFRFWRPIICKENVNNSRPSKKEYFSIMNVREN